MQTEKHKCPLCFGNVKVVPGKAPADLAQYDEYFATIQEFYTYFTTDDGQGLLLDLLENYVIDEEISSERKQHLVFFTRMLFPMLRSQERFYRALGFVYYNAMPLRGHDRDEFPNDLLRGVN